MYLDGFRSNSVEWAPCESEGNIACSSRNTKRLIRSYSWEPQEAYVACEAQISKRTFESLCPVEHSLVLVLERSMASSKDSLAQDKSTRYDTVIMNAQAQPS